MVIEKTEQTGAPTIDTRLQDQVNDLANRYGSASPDAPESGLYHHLKQYEDWIGQAHRFFQSATQDEVSLTYTSEWLLDNYYVVHQAIEQIYEDLPSGYLNRLPKLAGGAEQGFPRIGAIVRSVLAGQRMLLNLIEMQSILTGVQEQAPLTMGELWAVPIFLRYSMIEALALALEQVIHPHEPPALPPSPLRFNAAIPKASPSGSSIEVAEGLDASPVVANAILSLRAIAEEGWDEFFESTSRVEQILREDPAGVYPRMDFKTRDMYRKQVEELAFGSDRLETEVAQLALDEARGQVTAGHPSGVEYERAIHVGNSLLGEGRARLEQRIDFRPQSAKRFLRWAYRNAGLAFFGLVEALTALLLAGIAAILAPAALGWSEPAATVILVGGVILALVPALTIATNLVTWLVTLLVPPRILPKLDLRSGLPDDCATLVAIPALISNPQAVDRLAHQLLLHSLRNPEAGLMFALLTDFEDAPTETEPEDEDLVQHAVQVINTLNQNYPRPDGTRPFALLHRRRLWNEREGAWMGWERKRGKLNELNRFLLSESANGKPTSYSTIVGDEEALRRTRYVITLDADTILPRGAAERMVGAMAHPLNRPVLNREDNDICSGYSILQPRIEIDPSSAGQSWFTRIFASDAGLDLYSRAVSDAYQDLFGEGIYVGKGIYDLAAFSRSVDALVPENAVLSHDLLEGLLGRAGLASDITLIEDYPPSYFVQVQRNRRWIRGDWQLLPWLFHPARFGAHFSALDHWKLFDNLRRSLLAPALLALFVLGSVLLPGMAGWWAGLVALSLGVPLLTGLARDLRLAISGDPVESSLSSSGWSALRWLLAIAFLPYEAYYSLDAILVTLYRMLISHRHLLRWTTTAHASELFHARAGQDRSWIKFAVVSLFALLLSAWIFFVSPAALQATAPVLFLWLLSPLIARWLDRPVPERQPAALDEEDIILLRGITRRTWAFFERFIGPEDHWLPPDHFQESPVGMLAHRTSPTNIGLLLTSTLAAYDLGYIEPLGLAARLTSTFETLERLERFRGHFINWYDTLTLQALHPRYVSTVDSGNLAACFIVLAQGLRALPDAPLFSWNLWRGYLDLLCALEEILASLAGRSTPAGKEGEKGAHARAIREQIAAMRAKITAAREDRSRWYGLFREVTGSFWKKVSADIAQLVVQGKAEVNLETLRSLRMAADEVERQHLSVQRVIDELVPWVPLLEAVPGRLNSPDFAGELNELRDCLSYSPSLLEIRGRVRDSHSSMDAIRAKMQPQGDEETIAWLQKLDEAVQHGATRAGGLIAGFAHIADQAERYVNEMEFGFLYHPQREIFHIGYNLASSQLDPTYYDLLASEARIASIIAIAKDEVPPSHWLHLARPITRVDGKRVLLSWSSTMFEYLMPPLFLKTYPGTLLAESSQGAVGAQEKYGRMKSVPWGISEAGFYRFDASQNYQYRAFGVPGLGFKRGLGDDLVIAPYASLMAIRYAPYAVAHNARKLIDYSMLGLYGFYESIDFTPQRLLVGEEYARVREYMTHHQGMILLAMDNYFNDDINVKRMFSDARIQSAGLFLQEQVPLDAPLQSPYAENVKGVQRMTHNSVEVTSWTVPVETPIPQLHLISNGDFSVLVSNAGGGYASWKGTDLTRWQPDGVLDPWGEWVYLQEAEGSGRLWSAAPQPIPGNSGSTQVTFFAHMVVFRREEQGMVSTMEVAVAPKAPVEIRREHINNSLDTPRTLRLTSYGEVILAPQAVDARHPAFNKMFIESEYLPEENLQIFRRRPRSDQDAPLYLGHMLVLQDSHAPTRAHEADRRAFIGRYGSPHAPAALRAKDYLNGSSGATLDPIFSLGQELAFRPHESHQVAFLTFAAASRDELLDLARRYKSWALIESAFHQSDIAAQSWLGQQNMDKKALQNVLKTLSALEYPLLAARAPSEVLAANRLGQPGLWRFGISGNYPILLLEVDDPRQIDLVREALALHRYLVSRRFLVDVVILNKQQESYGAELNGMLNRLISRVNSEQWLNQRGGIFILYYDQMQEDERTLLRAAARVVLSGDRGSLGEQVPGYSIPVQHLPPFSPTRSPQEEPQAEVNPAVMQEPLQFDNGYGGFRQDGREYLIRVKPGEPTPAPWCNVIGYPQFGFLVTEAGSQCTWAANSSENRLTVWSNDPVKDPTGEALYLRDEETGETWTPTPLPAGRETVFAVRHGAGYTIFESSSHQIAQALRVYASPSDPVKIIHLHLQNTGSLHRRLTATQYVEWVLDSTRALSQPFILPEYDASSGCLLASNPYNAEFADRVAFLAASKPVNGVTADRAEFIGRLGSLDNPAAFNRLSLESRIRAGEDPCAVLQVFIDLPPGASEDVYFLLGQGASRDQAIALAKAYQDPRKAEAAWQETQAFWSRLLDALQVQTPSPAVNLILNRWLLYQVLSCRLWGRTAFYQSSGAFGFRDQLQDVLAALPGDPSITREQILNAARHQFEEGDVLHWWHPPSGRGIRTHFSDDLLWLPYVTAAYIEWTGDMSLLDEQAPFRHGAPLKPDEDERYGEYPLTDKSFTILEHCRRAIEKGATTGPHGLPLIGTGDWNDGFNRVGKQGQGESVWLAWFLIDVLRRFAAILQRRAGETDASLQKTAADWLARAQAYAASIEQSAWDGEWYRRAYYDDGFPLGSKLDTECRIDAIAQSWAVLSGAGDEKRRQQAMQSALRQLVLPEDRLVLLFTPPFNETPHDPGYIKGYLPGIRENGGQYTHAAVWTTWALVGLNMAREAGELFDLLNPIYQADRQEKADQYRVEPYVICADIYSVPPYVRRGGWTWYTGSAAWMYRLGIEAILGIRRSGEQLSLRPLLPPGWEDFRFAYRWGSAVYNVQVTPGETARLLVDGSEAPEGGFRLVDDGREHQVIYQYKRA